jgi:hypothetical protein
MMDLFYIDVIVVFFAITVALIYGCEQLKK